MVLTEPKMSAGGWCTDALIPPMLKADISSLPGIFQPLAAAMISPPLLISLQQIVDRDVDEVTNQKIPSFYS